jgi:transcriptional regulator with XRE-family HTH domain
LVTTAQLIVKARERKKLKPAELARLLGVTRSQVHGWEHGRSEPGLESLRRLADVFGVPIQSLIGDGDAA